MMMVPPPLSTPNRGIRSVRSSLGESSSAYNHRHSYIQKLAAVYDEQLPHNGDAKEKRRLQAALRDAVEQAEGLGACEVYRYRDRLGDLEWLDMWRTTTSGAEEETEEETMKPDPVIPGTGLVGTLWSSTFHKERRKTMRGSSSGGKPDNNNSQPTKGDDDDNNNPPPEAPGSGAVTTADDDDDDTRRGKVLRWRDLASIDQDPDTWACARVKEHLELQLSRAAGIPFDCDGVKGMVVFYSLNTADKASLQSLPNTIYLTRCASYIGSIVAMTEAQHACVAYRSQRSCQQSQSKPSDEEEAHQVAVTKEEETATTTTCVTEFTDRALAWYHKCWGAGLQIPPPMELQQVAWTWLGAFCGLLTLSAINEFFVHFTEGEYSLVIGPFGAMMTLLYALPSAPASQPRNVILGEAIAGGVSLALSYLPMPQWLRRAFGPAFGIAAMTAAGVTHPPAGAHATIWADNKHDAYFYAIVVLCSVVSVIPATIINNMSVKRQYPTYWGYLPKFLYRKIWREEQGSNSAKDK
ncbi:HPP family [Seminavis robusta]|uniref:HPP family n=1 Tax=Seminavis robusta TaxID=568900 RepID=A0A9N8HN63_9STRA|nr:HPP family [Seminavis robusta]|eukprot:Sro964_g225480.1 HPP family (523) ;mRNA; r:28376-30159